ncbi:DUF4180 domain-containing protein [Agromyces aureus]|uniref:Alpha/beta hydrolase n=1 Tax=Agromyces aureus TaxID=453304 RepID=A0A191WE91_9MICO|nr:DUF4180 domain-containing protein [Agromyces aureus]ANJ26542.1 alpha/beta hydrolase [Agromyces aureus]
MPNEQSSDLRVFALEPEGEPISTEDDAIDLIGSVWSHEAKTAMVPVERLDPAFFDLSTGLAGAFTQKLVNYRVRLVIVGDLTAYTEASRALSDYVWESNRGDQVWFVRDDAELANKLAARG